MNQRNSDSCVPVNKVTPPQTSVNEDATAYLNELERNKTDIEPHDTYSQVSEVHQGCTMVFMETTLLHMKGVDARIRAVICLAAI